MTCQAVLEPVEIHRAAAPVAHVKKSWVTMEAQVQDRVGRIPMLRPFSQVMREFLNGPDIAPDIRYPRLVGPIEELKDGINRGLTS
jgi:hypothetical protein